MDNGADYPTFYMDDITLPLCNYYKSKYMTPEEDLFFKRKQIEHYGFPFSESPDQHTIDSALQRDKLRMSRFHDEDLFDILDVDDD